MIENLWTPEHSPSYATIRTYIKNLRKILGYEMIENIKEEGYAMKFEMLSEAHRIESILIHCPLKKELPLLPGAVIGFVSWTLGKMGKES